MKKPRIFIYGSRQWCNELLDEYLENKDVIFEGYTTKGDVAYEKNAINNYEIFIQHDSVYFNGGKYVFTHCSKVKIMQIIHYYVEGKLDSYNKLCTQQHIHEVRKIIKNYNMKSTSKILQYIDGSLNMALEGSKRPIKDYALEMNIKEENITGLINYHLKNSQCPVKKANEFIGFIMSEFFMEGVHEK